MADRSFEFNDVDQNPAVDVDRFLDAQNVVTELHRLESQSMLTYVPGKPREIGVFALLGTAAELEMSEPTRTKMYDLILQSYAIGAVDALVRERGTKLIIPSDIFIVKEES